jgi:hypothetical protein
MKTQGKKVAFGLDHYQAIAKSLLAGIYKLGMEIHKEDKFLKESLYLRDIRKELKRFEGRIKNRKDGGSDDEAKKTSQIEEKIKISPDKIAKRQS